MAVAAAPAPPTLAAARHWTTRERPLTARRAFLTPTNRRQTPARFREAPIVHRQRCTSSSWAHWHPHHSPQGRAARAHVGAAAAQRKRQLQQQQRQRQQRQRQQRLAADNDSNVAAFNNPNLAAYAAELSQLRQPVADLQSSCVSFPMDSRQLSQSVASVPTVKATSDGQLICQAYHVGCCVNVSASFRLACSTLSTRFVSCMS